MAPPRRRSSSSARPASRAPQDESLEEEDWAAPETGEEQPYPDEGEEQPYPDEGEEEPYYDDPPPEDLPRRSRRDVTRVSHGESTGEGPFSEHEEDDDNPDATRAGPPVTLQIIEGPDAGRKKRFVGVRMVIGRSSGCDVELSDQSVSRRHVELVYGPQGVMLRDLVSGNGTRVNDERVEERLLVHDDVIALGKTRIRLIDDQERLRRLREEEEKARQPPPEPEESPEQADSEGADEEEAEEDEGEEAAAPVPVAGGKSSTGVPKAVLAAVAAVLLLLVVGVGIALARRKPPPPLVDPRMELAVKRMQLAWAAFERGDYAETVRLVGVAEESMPGVDKEGLGEQARKELAVVQALDEVKALMGEGRFDEARAKLLLVPQGSRSEDERKRLESDILEKEEAALLQRVEALLAERDVEKLEEARKLISRLPAARQASLLSRLQALEGELGAEADAQARQDRADKAAAAQRGQQRRAQAIDEAFGDVKQKFQAGDYRRAALECDRVEDQNSRDKEVRDRARQLKRLIPQFERVYLDAQRKLRMNSLEAAATPLRSAVRLYAQIGFGGELETRLKEQLARASVAAGKAVLQRGDLGKALSWLREAEGVGPDEPKLRELDSAIQVKVEELYMQAYMQRDRDPEGAAVKFRLVIDAAAEGSEVKRKAEEHLQVLQP